MTREERLKDIGIPDEVVASCDCSEDLRTKGEWYYCPFCFEPGEMEAV